jgi:hypothetical protein
MNTVLTILLIIFSIILISKMLLILCSEVHRLFVPRNQNHFAYVNTHADNNSGSNIYTDTYNPTGGIIHTNTYGPTGGDTGSLGIGWDLIDKLNENEKIVCSVEVESELNSRDLINKMIYSLSNIELIQPNEDIIFFSVSKGIGEELKKEIKKDKEDKEGKYIGKIITYSVFIDPKLSDYKYQVKYKKRLLNINENYFNESI